MEIMASQPAVVLISARAVATFTPWSVVSSWARAEAEASDDVVA